MTDKRAHRAGIVVVDDEVNMGKILSRILELEGYHVTAFSDPLAAQEHIKKQPPSLVITDMRMPGMSGVEILRAAKQANANTNVIVMTAYASVEKAVEVMREGAFDYITKPFKSDELVLTVAKAVANTRLLEENETLSEHLQRHHDLGKDIVGESTSMMAAKKLIAKVAVSDSAVLVRGESGTGKELVAKALHDLSPRKSKRFVAINCAGIPDNLIESELFGHEKGAFTGADKVKMGLVELAHEGTLFLDEIGELPLALQAKLLRVLQEHEIQRVGGLITIPVDVRIVAATNRDLKTAAAKKEFREDLYYRLNVIEVVMPPLRERQGDVAVLTDFFLDKICRRMGKGQISIAPDALQALINYQFPGNVRELENVIERAIVLCENDTIEIEDIPHDIRMAERFSAESSASYEDGGGISAEGIQDYRVAKDIFEKDYLQKAVTAAKGNISEASRLTGLSRRHFYEKLEKLGIKTDKG